MNMTPAKLVVIAGLYVVTWIGGWIVYPRDMSRRALAQHADGVAMQKQLIAEHPEDAVRLRDHSPVFRDGPRTTFRWCVPILPGILLVSSDYLIGPLWGNGGLRIVVFYGFGTVETPGFGWIA